MEWKGYCGPEEGHSAHVGRRGVLFFFAKSSNLLCLLEVLPKLWREVADVAK